ncbi:MAG: 50S ribosomal protein L23 [Candidatus Micrarchaeota archaeon]|nr:50S ribosomal protein L23 [Candidatus Micrarchaeota archaeon]
MYPLSTEKALGLIDRQNTISYVVDIRCGKAQIKQEFEKLFNVKVDKINTTTTLNNTKKAYIRINKAYKAGDVARKLKLV